MDFFQNYTSNTVGGSGNQSYFIRENENEVGKGRVFYKISVGGTYSYSILFSNVIDSTFSDGKHSHCNLIVDSWELTEARVGITATCNATSMEEPVQMIPLTFDGNKAKSVHPGEFFNSDPITLSPNTGDYLCLEISFKGKMIPYHEESILPTFVWENEKWVPSKLHPFASMIGCDRPCEKRIAFLGDSITQGIGTKINSYAHWNAVVADNLGERYAYWNLGLGYGRAYDAASDGAWLFKAKQNDIVVVCYGVNDTHQGYTPTEIKKNLEMIVDKLHEAGVQVILQSIPPFNYRDAYIDIWNEVNAYIRTVLAAKADMFFDCAQYLKKSDENPHWALYGGHPNEDGCKVWGEALAAAMKTYLGETIQSK